jgi:hypothetical protein
MYKQQNYSNEETQGNDVLADVICCAKRGDFIRIKYEIYFHKGKHKGETKTIFADLEDIECDDLAGFLIDQDYLTEYTNQEDYFDVKSREVFIADWERRLHCI